MTRSVLAFSVHLLTASGAAFALFAMLAAGARDWQMMFLWLGLAFLVDGIDGPLARKVDVKRHAPHWDGVLLDLIIDFLTYVFIPAYALAQAGLMGVWEGWFCAIAIVTTGVIYFADTRMKTKDNSFSGFPGCWNMVVLVFFALTPPGWVMIAIVALLSLTQFFSLKFIHPVRTERWRGISLTVMILWGAAATWICIADFQTNAILGTVLMISSLYLLLAGIAQQLRPVYSTRP